MFFTETIAYYPRRVALMVCIVALLLSVNGVVSACLKFRAPRVLTDLSAYMKSDNEMTSGYEATEVARRDARRDRDEDFQCIEPVYDARNDETWWRRQLRQLPRAVTERASPPSANRPWAARDSLAARSDGGAQRLLSMLLGGEYARYQAAVVEEDEALESVAAGAQTPSN